MIAVVERTNPFPGLRSFEPDEDYLFFGREEHIDQLLERLRKARFLAVVGASGSGKSSLVRSGLIPSLHSGYMTAAGSSWRTALFRPGDDPLGNLAQVLVAPEVLGQGGELADTERALVETTLRRSAQGLVECLRQARIPEDDNLLVVVDQFEELFRFKDNRRLAGSRDEAVAFVKLLLEATRQRELPVFVVLTMRSDFIGNCTEFPGLAETVNDGQYLVPRMSREQRRSAIAGPVAVGGAEISQRLVLRLLNDVGDDPDQLPILQHALMRTWDHWEGHHSEGEPLDLRHYEAIGTLREALSQHAEEAYQELPGEAQREIAERLFKALTDKGSDNRGVRRPIRLKTVCAITGASEAEAIAIIDRFRLPGRSFLMPPADVPLTADSIIDISHESLMRVWTRLEGWVEEEAQSAQVYVRLAKAAEMYQEGRGGLWRDPELQLALAWRKENKPTAAWAQRYDPSFERAILFLESSREARDRETARHERQQRRQLRRTRAMLFVLGSALLLILLFFLTTLASKEEAEASKDRAEEAATAAMEAKGQAEEERNKAMHQRQFAEEQERRALEAQRKEAEARDRAEAQEQAAMHNAAAAREQEERAKEARRQAEAERLRAVTARDQAEVARDQAERSQEETQRLRRLELARGLAVEALRLVQQGRPELAALAARQAFRMNSEAGGDPRRPELFDALRGTLAAVGGGFDAAYPGHADAVRALAVSPDGAALYSGGDDGEIRRLNLGSGTAGLELVDRGTSAVRSLAVSPDSRLLAAGRLDGTLELRRLGGGGAPRTLTAHRAAVTALAFSADGSLLASGGADGNGALWEPATTEGASLRGVNLSTRIYALAFHPQGAPVASASSDGVLRLWKLDGSATHRDLPGFEDLRSVAYSPDGALLAAGAADGSIYLLRPDGPGTEPLRLVGHASAVNSLAFTPDGEVLASASSDGTVRLWDPRRPSAEPLVLRGHDSWVWALAPSPDGRRLYSASADRTVRRWATRGEDLATEVCRRAGRNLTREEWAELLPDDIPYQKTCPELPAAGGAWGS